VRVSNQQPETVSIHIGGSVTGQVVGGRGNVAGFRQAAGAENGASAGVRPDRNGNVCGIVVADVQASGRLNSRRQLRMQSELRRMFADGVAALGQRWDDLGPTRLGDGISLVLPLESVPLPRILDVLLPAIVASHREHVAVSSADSWIKLRIAVHFGLLDRTGGQWSGEPLVHAARLVDARVAKRKLHEAGGRLVLIFSDDVYQKVVRQGHSRLGEDEFHRIPINEKETSTHAWIHLDLA
jgi:hypothetical protein